MYLIAALFAVKLACTGFDHGTTTKVEVRIAEDGSMSVVEIRRDGKEFPRVLTPEEVAKEEYEISAIFNDYKRTIKRSPEGGWVVGYSCGENRPLSCTENP